MGAGKNKHHRKKRISKHVLEAEARKQQEETEGTSTSAEERKGTAADAPSTVSSDATTEQGVASARTTAKTKDPEVASSYLSLWEYDRTNGTKEWKFNKNTQSVRFVCFNEPTVFSVAKEQLSRNSISILLQWLLRHMYESDKVSKNTFALLVEYLSQGGGGVRARVEEDAKSRAWRYKEWEKNQPRDEGKDAEDAGVANDVQQNDGDTSNAKDAQSSHSTSWVQLDGHSKRKEYKRARKVIDALKSGRKESEKK